MVPFESFRADIEAVVLTPAEVKKSNAGRKPIDVIVMFRMLVLQSLYNLSDEQVEYQVSDRMSFTRFLRLGIEDRDKLEQLIDKLGIRTSVEMLGRREDMASVYASLDVMVSSSRQEGLPMAILEGMASGRALVATAVGEVPSVVIDGQTGVLVPAEEVEPLAAGLVELLRDTAERTRLGTAARKLVEEEYSADRMTADYLSVYEEAIAASSLVVMKGGAR